jgi:hypothetical protein
MTKPIELTVEDIEKQITRAKDCERMTMPGGRIPRAI